MAKTLLSTEAHRKPAARRQLGVFCYMKAYTDVTRCDARGGWCTAGSLTNQGHMESRPVEGASQSPIRGLNPSMTHGQLARRPCQEREPFYCWGLNVVLNAAAELEQQRELPFSDRFSRICSPNVPEQPDRGIGGGTDRAMYYFK